MASNNIILAVPSANTSVNYDLPPSESAKLSFSPEDIDGLKLDANGGLVISFVEGGNVTISNFQTFIDNGNTLSLADGTQVDPKLLFSALGGQNDNPFPASDVTKIGIPSEGTTRDITLEPGKKYLFNFDLSETKGADVKDGKMVIAFENGGKIVVNNYETAMAGKNAPELSLASKTCVVTGDELITNIQQLAATNPIEETVVVVEEEVVAKPKSKIADADMKGADDIGAHGATKLAYKATEPTAEDLAAIETAAGGPAGAGGARNSGYGYNSTPGSDPFRTNPDIGPLGQTNLGYKAPTLTPGKIFDTPPVNSGPQAIGPGIKIVDETNLANGPVTTGGSINIDFGADGPGGVNPNGAFSSGGSKTGGLLTSHGESVNVTIVGNSYVGTTAQGVKVFQLDIDPVNGNYKFTQYEQLDHADGNNPNDQITLNFGVVARDGDGDSLNTTIQIGVLDDAPSASGASGSVDETDFGTTISVSGNLTVNYGQDGPGRVETSNSFAATGSVKGGVLASSGVPVVVTETSDGYEGRANGVLVFQLAVDPQTGAFTYTQYKNLDHADASNPNDEIILTFGTNVVDYDGDKAPAPIVIKIVDDGPGFQTCNCGENGMYPGSSERTIDETYLNTSIVTEGRIVADFGADAPGSYALKDGSFVSSGSKLNGQLTHNGVPVVVTLVNGVYVGKAGDVTIFTLSINAQTGDYKFALFDNFDHADASNPDDIITLDFKVLASDYEGDSVEGSIRINVKDDAPVAHNDVNTVNTATDTATGNVVTGLNGGPGAADNLSTDGPNTVTKISFGGNEVDVPATGTVSIDGQYGTLTISADGSYTYTQFANGGGAGTGPEKQFVGGPALPDFVEGDALDGVEQQSLGVAPGNLTVDAGDTVSITFRSEGAGFNNTFGVFTVAADGTLKAEKILSTHADSLVAGETFSYTAASDATSVGFFVMTNGAAANNEYAGLDFNTGTINFVFDYGLPTQRDAKVTDNGTHVTLVFTSATGVVTPLYENTYFTSDRGDMASLNNDGQVHVVSGLPNSGDNTVLRIGFEDIPNLGDKDYNDFVFDISIKDKDCGCGGKDQKDVFEYTLKDGDGDTSKATLTLNGQAKDDVPVIIAPAAETVDETDLSHGVITETGTISVNFGSDAAGATITGNGAFTSTGSKLNGQLTSAGVAVVVSQTGNTYTGVAGGVTIFTLTIGNDGKYTFKLFEQLDHADGSNPNDVITLNFGVVATDCDGDKSTTTVVVNVKDDAPVANDDGLYNVNQGAAINGNVTTNDVVGQDVVGKVISISFNGQTVTVPATGNAMINGTHGTLVINSAGVYTYTAKPTATGVDTFTYVLRDNDGDTDSAKLEICVNDIDTTPEIVKPAVEVVDETNLAGGALTETGNVTANFFNDGPGTFAGNNSFTSSGSKTGGVLSHNGLPITVTQVGDTYYGVAAPGTGNEKTVFTLKINADGSYVFKLFDNLDHADGSNPNDVITLDFGVIATDADGDKSLPTTITVQVKDDAPIANDDGLYNVNEGASINGNVTTNDKIGQDGYDGLPAQGVVAISFNGQTVTIPQNGTNVTINGTYGTLTINMAGVYTYTAKTGVHGQDDFTYTLRDRDGDTDTAKLSVCVNDIDDTPVIVKPAVEILDETNLAGGALTETGNVTANFFNDGPGTFAGNNSFTSSGSKLGGTLSHNGFAITVTQVGDTYYGVAAPGTGNEKTVFTLKINADGSYVFKLFDNLDHADASNPNDVITLDFGVIATDADGDKSLPTTITVQVKDDAPIANDDGLYNVNEGASVTGNVTTNDNIGQDSYDGLPAQGVVAVTFNGQTVNVPQNGATATIVGQYGTLFINMAGVYTYTAKTGVHGQDDFTYTLRDRDGDTDTAKLSICVNDIDTTPEIVKPAVEILDETNLAGGALTETGNVTANFFNDGPGTFAGNNSFTSSGSKTGGVLSHNGLPITVTQVGDTYYGVAAPGTGNEKTVFTLKINADGSYVFKLFDNLDHADGSNPNDVITLDFGVIATDADGDKSLPTTITVQVKDDAPIANDDGLYNVNEGASINGNVTTNDKIGQDGYDGLPAQGVVAISFNGQTVTIPQNGTNVTINGTYGTLTINMAGVYTYTAHNNSAGQDDFTYTLRDRDGDTDTAKLSICVNDIDDTPSIVKPATEVVDESNLSGGVITESGQVTANFFNDGPGTFAGNNSFTSSGSKLGGNLTSNGSAITVTMSGNTYTGKTAGGVTVFTMAVAADGSYVFRLFEQLDHADGSNPNDIINLDFGVVAIDADGDKSLPTTITVQVKDDAPVANSDYCTLLNSNQVSSNALANDVIGQDGPGKISAVTFNGVTTWVPGSGSVSVATAYGTLTLSSNGDYTYKLHAGSVQQNATDNFTLTVSDYDGDTAHSTLQINMIKYTGTTIQGTEGNDTIYGGSAAELIYGNGGDDWIHGGQGNDVIYGGAGNDTIYGEAGDDHIIGGPGNDTLYGGAGADTFWFLSINDGMDTIKDFNRFEGDKLELSNIIGPAFDPLTDAINDFVFATYDGHNTIISVNANGTGAAGATSIITLEGVNVSVSDLFNNGSIIA